MSSLLFFASLVVIVSLPLLADANQVEVKDKPSNQTSFGEAVARGFMKFAADLQAEGTTPSGNITKVLEKGVKDAVAGVQSLIYNTTGNYSVPSMMASTIGSSVGRMGQ